MVRSLAVTAALSCCAAFANASVWDNFPGDTYDTSQMLTSERNTQVGQGPAAATWTVDDATFFEPVFIQAIEWIGIRETMSSFEIPYSYSLADWSIFTRTVDQFGDVSFTPVAGEISVSWTELENLGPVTIPTSQGRKFEAFRAIIEFSSDDDDNPAFSQLLLEEGEYWFGARLVGDPGNIQNGGTGGRHFIARSSTGSPDSVDEGYNYDQNFNFFQPWARASERNPFSNDMTEFAYRIHYAPIPEPAGVIGLLALGLAVIRTRRS